MIIVIIQTMEPYSWWPMLTNLFQTPKEKIFLEKHAWDWSVYMYVNIWCVSNPSPPSFIYDITVIKVWDMYMYIPYSSKICPLHFDVQILAQIHYIDKPPILYHAITTLSARTNTGNQLFVIWTFVLLVCFSANLNVSGFETRGNFVCAFFVTCM